MDAEILGWAGNSSVGVKRLIALGIDNKLDGR